MLGITTADAIAFGMLVLAALAAFRGATRGESARKASPPQNTFAIGASMFADTAAMQAMTAALNRMAQALEACNEARAEEHKDHVLQVMERLTRVLDEREGAQRRR